MAYPEKSAKYAGEDRAKAFCRASGGTVPHIKIIPTGARTLPTPKASVPSYINRVRPESIPSRTFGKPAPRLSDEPADEARGGRVKQAKD